MEFAVLGPLEVRDGGDPVDVGPRMPRVLLASLLIEANRVVSQDRLIDQLWGDDSPAQATAALQVYVSNLRRALERDRGTGKRPRMLLTRAPGYVLEVPAEALDATRFEDLGTEGRSHLAGGNPGAAREVFRRALGLWRGEPYADLASEAFVALEAARL
ncbi:MAG TPA: winged helix-turn-helix domain-containing protein, partial [Acidimicrobiia bacterium]|nr:winged helix-turn-helix domain-containing protein [Acidimicrobiia bacterium]